MAILNNQMVIDLVHCENTPGFSRNLHGNFPSRNVRSDSITFQPGFSQVFRVRFEVDLPRSTGVRSGSAKPLVCDIIRLHGLSWDISGLTMVYGTLWLFNIAMDNDPFIDGLPINSMLIFHGYVE